jgi:hypothetical protein
MNLLIKDRASGKTTGLIYTSEVTQYPIVTFNRKSTEYIKEMAREMGCLIPEPLCFGDFRDESNRGCRLPENILVDEVGMVIEDALNAYFHTNVVSATMTDSLKEHYAMVRKAKER